MSKGKSDETGGRLEVRSDSGGERHYLSGCAVHCGDALEVRIGGAWVPVRYEANWLNGLVSARLVMSFDGDDRLREILLPRFGFYRWPGGGR